MLTEASDEIQSSRMSDSSKDLKVQNLVSCPQCKKKFQILNPAEGLIYTCNSCETPFMLQVKSGSLESFVWSEDEVYNKILEIQGAAGPSQISRLWRRAFQELDNPQAHKDFILQCQRMNHMDCAKDKYRLLKLYLNWDGLPLELKNILYPKDLEQPVWQQRLPWILLVTSLILILVGLLHPILKNTFGAGVILGFLTISFYRARFKKLLF